jgi:putative ABC transport system permease protein
VDVADAESRKGWHCALVKRWGRLVSFARSARDDARFALRRMRRAPRFFVVLVLITSAGVGATTAMASLVQAALLRQPPFPDAERLVVLWSTSPGNDRVGVSLPDVQDWKQAQSFERLAVMHDWGFGLSVPGAAPVRIIGSLVSGDYFPMLGVKPMLGRLLGSEDDAPGVPCRAVLSEMLFRTRMGSNAGLLGNSIELDGNPCTVVGVAEPAFNFAAPQYSPTRLWVNVGTIWPGYWEKVHAARDEQQFVAFGKLRPGVSIAGSSAELAALTERLSHERPGRGLGVRVAPLHDEIVAPFRPRMWGLFAAIGIVFLATCSNVAGLFLVRTQARRGELALRSALGATRSRLALQLLTEMSLVFVIAAPVAGLLAHWFVALFSSITASSSSVPAATVDNTVLGGCILLSSATGLLFGLVPALALSRVSPGCGLVEAGTGAAGHGHQRQWRAALVVAQIAVACALVTTSGTAFRAVAELLRTPGGFEAKGLVSIKFTAQRRLYSDAALLEMFQRLSAQLRARPGIQSVTICTGVALDSGWFEAGFQRVQPDRRQPPSRFFANVIPPGFFDVLGIPLLEGRDFDPSDSQPGARRVVLINERLRSSFFPNENPIGQLIEHDFNDNTAPAEIVGVVGDVRRFGLQVAPSNEIYMPLGQYFILSQELIVRADPSRAEEVAKLLPSWIAETETQLPLSYANVMTGGFERTVRSEQRLSGLLSTFALACLALAALGLYSAISYAAVQRTREFGIRVALGAPPLNIVWLVTGAALRWVAYALVLALCAVLGLGGLLSQQITGAPAFDLRSFLIAAAVVAIVALGACIGPALRALRLAPANALRSE